MPSLLHILDDRVIHKFTLKDGIVNIGRGKDNQIVLDDRAISGHHARLTIKEHHNPFMKMLKEVIIEDLDSTNGTFINGNRITSRKTLSDGDILKFGDHQFKYEDALDKG